MLAKLYLQDILPDANVIDPILTAKYLKLAAERGFINSYL